MKKIVLVLALMFPNFAFADAYVTTVSDCDDAQMRAVLDNAAAEQGTVITIVECEQVEENKASVMTSRYANTWNHHYAPAYRPCENQMKPVSAVVRRDYFVRETIQEYKPVVKYVPSNRYVRVRPACDECGL